MMQRYQKITLREMRASGVRGLLIYGADYKCSQSIRISAERSRGQVHLLGMRQARCRRQAAF
jgi:hypothetical protein